MKLELPTSKNQYLDSLLEFIENSPTPFHASHNMAVALEANGFRMLNELQDWNLGQEKKFYVRRNDTSIFAFRLGNQSIETSGMCLVGAHLDSPCLKINPNPVINQYGYESINVEVYGSALVRTWFDRELSAAGKVYYLNRNSEPSSQLINLKEANCNYSEHCNSFRTRSKYQAGH